LGGFNPYGYVGIPTAFVDPLGLQVCDLKGNDWEFNSLRDVDFRGQGKTHLDALDEAFKRTGVPKDQFEVTQWGRTPEGKTIPVEWKGPRGAEVNMDIPEWNNINPNGNNGLGKGPYALHIGYSTSGKGNYSGHIFVENVPATRYKVEY
ncbi:hypothetical protein HYE60_07515, partial [Aggregatibacter actinomycetemcomitans]|uniref:polymorphic toxin type 47 domain-containing protein n=1 Tax=Aggregatibacter actinomycetemcomitans TaxID=714 RepID=UPI00197C3D84